ncbi:MAG: tetraacyldisaccharide 4'-kinase [Vicinamibacterales bacterium]
MLSTLYAAAVRRRRERYAARPELRRRLRRPVISVGNLAVGGRGKTPIAASIARMLRDADERPAILSRGYGRARPEAGVVVVRDPDGIRADLARAGDEPLMLARQLPGVSVLACADRYLAGRLAEHHLGATVHVLDDGFQHLQLDRDIDLLIVGRDDVLEPATLPAGRLREPLDTIIAADAVLTADDEVLVRASGAELPVFGIRRHGNVEPPAEVRGQPVVAVAGIASPERFFDDLRAGGWTLADTMTFRDHHRYTSRDVARLLASAERLGAVRIVTTEKDLIRLLPFRPFRVPVVHVPIVLDPDPIEQFREWLATELSTTRGDVRG